MFYHLDDLTIDTVKQEVWRSEQGIKISGLSYQFLSFMLTKGTAVVTFQELMDGVWSRVIVNEDTVTQRVLLIRNALGDNGRNPQYIRSVRGQGYQLVAQPIAQNKALNIVKLPSRQPRPLKWLTACVVIVGMVSLLGLAGFGLTGFGLTGFGQFSETENKGPLSKYLERANYYVSIGQQDDNDRAIELFQRVLLIEPKSTQAMLGLSRAYTISMCRFNADRVLAEQADTLARKVIALEPENFRAFRILGLSQDCRGHVMAARAAYLHAIELDPNNDVRSQSALAYSLGETGNLAKALALNLSVREKDPEQTFTLIQLARVFELLGLHSRAETLYAESFELYPDNIYSNLSYPRHLFHQQKFSAAREILSKAKQRPLHPDLLVLSAELALLDNNIAQASNELLAAVAMRPSSEYLEILANLYPSVQSSSDWLSDKLVALNIKPESAAPEERLKQAMLFQALGENQAGIDALLSAVELGYRNKDYLQVSPLFKGLRSNSEFTTVIERINLAVKRELDTVYSSGLLHRIVAKR